MATDVMKVRARAAEGLLLAAVVLAPWPYGCAPGPWRFALSALVLVASALWFSGSAPADGVAWRLRLAALGLPMLGALQIVMGVSVSPVETAEAVLQLLATLGALVAWAEIARVRGSALRLAAALLGVVVLQAVFGVVQHALAPRTIYGLAPSVAQMPFGSFVNHNHFAGLVEMATPLALGWALGLWRRAGGPTPAALALVGAGLALAAAHLGSRSRGGLLALLVALASLGLVWWVRHRRRTRRGVDAGVAIVAVSLVMAFGWLAVPGETRSHLATLLRGARESSGSYRLDTARATLALAASRPWLGAGLGAYADAVTRFKVRHGDVRVTHAESDALQLAAEGGLAGLLACGLLAGLLIGLGRERIAERDDPVRRGIAIGAVAGGVGLLVHSWIDFNLHIPANALAFAALIGLATARPSPRVAESVAPAIRGRGWAWLLAAVLALVALASAWRAVGAGSLAGARRQAAPRARIALLSAALPRHAYLAEGYRERARARMALLATGSRAVQLDLIEGDLARVLALRPLWAEAWADRAWVLWVKGDRQQAWVALDRARALDPMHVGIQAFARRLESDASEWPSRTPRANLK